MPNRLDQVPLTQPVAAPKTTAAPKPSLASPYPGTATTAPQTAVPLAAAMTPQTQTSTPQWSLSNATPAAPVTVTAATPPPVSDNSINLQNPNNIVQGYLDQLLSSNGAYLGNAARRGLEVANSRGLLNSSMAAGASQRAAMEAVQPLLNNVLGVHNAQQDFQFRRTLQSDATAQQDWLRSNDFADRFNANIAMLPINSAMGMLDALTQYALTDPETFTPDVMSGFTTFFNNNMLNLLGQYFPNGSSTTPINGTNPPVRPALDSTGGIS